MNFPKTVIQRTVRPVANGYEITLSSDKFARGVFMSIDGIDHFFENNYFNLMPAQTVTVKAQTTLPQAEFEAQLKIVSLPDAY